MSVARNAPCPCGSGLKYKKCHGLTRGEEVALRRRLDALAEAHDLAAVFPFLRPEGVEVLAYAERVADELGDDEDVGPDHGERGLPLLSSEDRRRLVASYASRYPGPWQEVCEQVGDPDVAARGLAVGAIRAAIAERRLPLRGVLEEVEAARETIETPAKALLFCLQPSHVWALLDAFAAAEASAGAEEPGAWLRAIDEVAWEQLDEEHGDRVRTLARHLARRLPLPGLPRASELLARGCDEVQHERDLADELAACLLTSYVVRLGAESEHDAYLASLN